MREAIRLRILFDHHNYACEYRNAGLQPRGGCVLCVDEGVFVVCFCDVHWARSVHCMCAGSIASSLWVLEGTPVAVEEVYSVCLYVCVCVWFQPTLPPKIAAAARAADTST